MRYTYIPRRLDDQWKILWFDVDVAIPFLAILFLGVVTGHLWKSVLIGAVIARGILRLKSDKHPAFAWHWVYWYLPSFMMPLRRTPPSHIREMVG